MKEPQGKWTTTVLGMNPPGRQMAPVFSPAVLVEHERHITKNTCERTTLGSCSKRQARTEDASIRILKVLPEEKFPVAIENVARPPLFVKKLGGDICFREFQISNLNLARTDQIFAGQGVGDSFRCGRILVGLRQRSPPRRLLNQGREEE